MLHIKQIKKCLNRFEGGIRMLTNELYHIGKGHDDNPPGRGSGRYPYGSGERPYQGDEKKTSITGKLVGFGGTVGLFNTGVLAIKNALSIVGGATRISSSYAVEATKMLNGLSILNMKVPVSLILKVGSLL